MNLCLASTLGYGCAPLRYAHLWFPPAWDERGTEVLPDTLRASKSARGAVNAPSTMRRQRLSSEERRHRSALAAEAPTVQHCQRRELQELVCCLKGAEGQGERDCRGEFEGGEGGEESGE